MILNLLYILVIQNLNNVSLINNEILRLEIRSALNVL